MTNPVFRAILNEKVVINLDLEHPTKEEQEILESFDRLAEELRKSRKDGEYVSILNPVRLEMARFCWLAIQKVLRENGCRAEVTFGPLEFDPNVYAISVEGDEIDIGDMEWFCRAAEFADNTEVYPLTSNKIRMTFGFNRMLTRI